VGGEPRFTQVAPNDDNPLGDLARNVLGTAAVDVDGDAVGIAVMSMSGGGTWQFQRNNSPLWENVGSVSSKAARLIGALDRIRFLPDDNFAGVATLKFRASDGSAGTAGSLLKPKGTAFSKNIETGLLLVSSGPLPPVNNAPVLDDAGSPVLAAVAEELKSPPGNAVSSLLGTSFTDADGTQKGIAIVGLTQTNRGTWQYSTNNGKKWLNIGNVSIANALLLRESDHIRFVPGKDFNGLAEIAYHAWDRSRGTAGSRANLAVPNGTGSSSAFSLEDETARVNVTPVNDAPVLITKPTPRLTPISPNVLFPAGDPVSSILGTAASDVEGNPLGIAVIGATGSGTWEYFTVASGIWDALGLVTPMNARLLDSSDLVRFRPDAAFTGTAKLFFKAWDHSEGVTDTLQSTAFSKATESATLIVNSIEERPLLDSRSTPTLSPVSVNDNDPPGNLVSALLGSWAFDADPGSQLGIAIIDATTVGGTWQYSSDGLTWDNLDTVSTTSPKRLLGIDRIRFKPNPGFSGTASLKYKAWDANSSDPLGPLALSTARETATVSVNSSPVL